MGGPLDDPGLVAIQGPSCVHPPQLINQRLLAWALPRPAPAAQQSHITGAGHSTPLEPSKGGWPSCLLRGHDALPLGHAPPHLHHRRHPHQVVVLRAAAEGRGLWFVEGALQRVCVCVCGEGVRDAVGRGHRSMRVAWWASGRVEHGTQHSAGTGSVHVRAPRRAAPASWPAGGGEGLCRQSGGNRRHGHNISAAENRTPLGRAILPSLGQRCSHSLWRTWLTASVDHRRRASTNRRAP